MKIMASLAFAFSCAFSPMLLAVNNTDSLTLNHIQVKGTHNSYHLKSAISFHASHKYTHLSLGDQLAQRGIRAFELDVHQPVMRGDLTVYHIGVIDGKTSCSKFKDCLRELKSWSDNHPDHVTIFIWVEIKDSTGGPKFANFDQVDQEIREVLGDRLLTPDLVQGNFPTLRSAVQNKGWPSVKESRGKFLFMLDQDDRTEQVYLQGESLRGRVMFPRASESTMDRDWAAVAKTAPGSFHSEAMARNFLVSDNICMAGDESSDCFLKLDRARDAGTHLLMDDFEGDNSAQRNGNYFVQFGHRAKANCNPFMSSALCNNDDIDRY